MKIRHSCGIAALFFTGGCATLIHGTKERVTLSSAPTAAQVLIDEVAVATTPCAIALERKESDAILRFEKEGFYPAEVILNRKLSGWTAGNAALYLAGPIGVAVDMHTGAAYRLAPTEIYVVLHEAGVTKLPEAAMTIKQKPSVAGTGASSRREGRFSYGYGLSGLGFILPVPYAEAGFRLGPVGLRGNIGFVFAYMEVRAEVVFFDRFFIYDGTNGIVQVEGRGDVFGIGLDIYKEETRKFYRFELSFLEYEDGTSYELPRVGVGWRF